VFSHPSDLTSGFYLFGLLKIKAFEDTTMPMTDIAENRTPVASTEGEQLFWVVILSLSFKGGRMWRLHYNKHDFRNFATEFL
jgi:hypothetical protein